MRGDLLLLVIVAALAMTLRFPFLGILLWSWYALQSPHQEAYGFVQTAPLNLVIALVTVTAWMLSRERKAPPVGLIFWLLIIFLVWITINSFLAFNPDYSWPFWSRTWKIFAWAILVATMATSRNRIYAITWISVISLFYFGVKGGLFTLVTGGSYVVQGPPGTIIADNNQLAVAMLMTLPLANFLRSQVRSKPVQYILLAGILLTCVAIIGTYSRGAMVGMVALGAFMLLRLRNRLQYLAMGSVVAAFILMFMPQRFFVRMHTIGSAGQDESFQGRLDAWNVAFQYARDHFPFGAGLYGPQQVSLFHYYLPGVSVHAAHSIYFQVLGENGFVGLTIYILILITAFAKCSSILGAARKLPGQRWAADFVVAIQSSLFVFCVSGALLSMAYYDLFLFEVALLLPLGELILKEGRQKRRASATAQAPLMNRQHAPMPLGSRAANFMTESKGALKGPLG
jgi:probable O-glycosylation ligase (exosortase A-associated)